MSAPPAQDAHRYAREGNASLLRMALSSDPSLLLSLDSDSQTPLQACLSALPPSVQCVEACIEAFNDLEGGGYGEAARKKCLENGDGIGNTALISAATTGNFEIVTLLVGAGADVTAQNQKGVTALHYAASKGHVNIGRLLISKGADINARDKANQLPLHRAATTGSLPSIHLILASLSPTKPEKPRLNLSDRAGNTPLHLAVESGHAECAVALIEGGADRDRGDSEGMRAEEIEGVGGVEAKKVREFIKQKVGPLDS
ncbi:ankyrin repeat domain-containing protein [Sporobolomyces salmoneus]|uniref:ankyrin repeat domain-containing protein n=1 Tax=Sporobolomyces salmoneus TaxID=183962 RepID=UPI003179C4A5